MKKSFLPIINAIGLILVIGLNYLSNAKPINGKTIGDISDLYPNLFVPAPITFSIWGLIYVGLTGFVVYQLIQYYGKSNTLPDGVLRIGVLFFISCCINVGWIYAWLYQLVWLSLLLMFGLLTTLIAISLRLQASENLSSHSNRWFIHVPFSIYLGWISIATIANVTSVLVAQGWSGFGLSEPVWAAIMIAVGTLITHLVLQAERDIAFGAVVIWAFIGIIIKQGGLSTGTAPLVSFTALFGAATILAFVLWIVTTKRVSVQDI